MRKVPDSLPRWGWWLLALAWLVGSGWAGAMAPCGHWANRVFGHEAWLENDPGAYYVASAHELAWGGVPLYTGHPGATLVPLLRGVQELHYALGAPDGASFTEYTARHLPRVFALSKLLMALLHLASFAALHALARQLLRDTRAAALATLGYATSFPVLYYAARISVEPLMVGLLALGFLAAWRCEDRLADGREGPALGWAALAGLAAMSGAVTKLVFLGPLPAFLALEVALAGPRRPTAAWRPRIGALAVYAASSLAALALYSQIVDWPDFFRQWRLVAVRTSAAPGLVLRDLLPGFAPERIFVLAELGFWLVAALGWLHFARWARDRRGRALWLSAYLGYALLVFAQRAGREGSLLPFNYAFVPQAILALFFGHALAELAPRLRMPASGPRPALAAGACLAALHGVGAVAVLDARRFDARAFDANRPAFELVAQLGPSQRIAVEPEPGTALMGGVSGLHGMTFPYFDPERRSVLADAFASMFVPVDAGRISDAKPRLSVPAVDGSLVVVHRAEARP